jgi:hypothetical protein
MVFHSLNINDKPLFYRFAHQKPHVLSVYAFENIFIWRFLFDIRWVKIDNALCLFFKDGVGMFMPLPPLGKQSKKVLDVCFSVMEEFNHNKDMSRIENVEKEELAVFKALGYRFYEKGQEYIVAQKDIAAYKGNRFKHKRALANFFKKNTVYEVRDYSHKFKEGVLTLYRRWMSERVSKNKDSIYCAMLEDSFKALSKLLAHYEELDVRAKVVFCDGKLAAFTSGVPISDSIFCINFEIADLSYKGLAAFIFSAFAESLKSYAWINIMDDSGIENIKKTKLTFKPAQILSSYTALLESEEVC